MAAVKSNSRGFISWFSSAGRSLVPRTLFDRTPAHGHAKTFSQMRAPFFS